MKERLLGVNHQSERPPFDDGILVSAVKHFKSLTIMRLIVRSFDSATATPEHPTGLQQVVSEAMTGRLIGEYEDMEKRRLAMLLMAETDADTRHIDRL